MDQIRVRFAPSPTGPLHIGGLRTALFNYLFAKKHGGKFLLRIEDTDQSRYVQGAEEYIVESLLWCGLNPDEGPGFGGDFGPYRQSERKESYRAYAEQLINSGTAYYAFDTAGELEQAREQAEKNQQIFTYDSATRLKMRNSLALSSKEVEALLEQGTAYVIRFRFPEKEKIIMNDLIRGEVQVDSSTLDDKVLFKSDGMPTYHLANVVDDHAMKISHVIRGEEWLPSLPLHVSLYRAFGWEKEMPDFAHLPLIMKPDGKGKLSKRDGDKGGFPVFPLEWTDPETGEVASGYREAGYFPEACINILALLGWNPGSEKEMYSIEELISDFDLHKVGKSGAKFDPDKARWFNHQYLQVKPLSELAEAYIADLKARGFSPQMDFVEKVLALTRERADFIAELWEQSSFFFQAPDSYDEKVVKKRWKENTAVLMSELVGILKETDSFEPESIELIVKAEIEKREWGMGAVMNAWRLLLVGEAKGPSLFEIAALLGKDETIGRMEKGIEVLG